MSPSPDYFAYIHSDAWRARADAAKARAGYRCQVCNRSSTQVQLDAHHRTYERFGDERDDDITVLCRDCHELYERNKRLHRSPVAAPHADPAPAQRDMTTLPPATDTHTAPKPKRKRRDRTWSQIAILLALAAYIGWNSLFPSPPRTAQSRAATPHVTQRLIISAPTLTTSQPPTPTAPPALPSASAPIDHLAALAAYQASRYAAPDYTTACPYTTTPTNVRTGPSTDQTQVIAVVPVGSCIPVSAQTPDGQWVAFALDLEDDTTALAWLFANLLADAPTNLPLLAAQSGPLPNSHPKPLPLRIDAPTPAAVPTQALPSIALPTITPTPAPTSLLAAQSP